MILENCQEFVIIMMSYHLTFPEVGVIIANVDDLDSIEQMCVKAKLLINCVGPVNFLMVF